MFFYVCLVFAVYMYFAQFLLSRTVCTALNRKVILILLLTSLNYFRFTFYITLHRLDFVSVIIIVIVNRPIHPF